MSPILTISNLGKTFSRSHHVKPLYASSKEVDTFWALKDMNFTVERGEMIGIIGRNGSGKTTLLKIIGGILFPTEGSIELNGSVSMLLGTAAGMHMQLTGRENILLTSTLYGVSKKDAQAKVEDILTFAELSDVEDTQLKFYSNGMKGRLAFSIALHLDLADILLIDEVLAVGDREFREKSKKKMLEFMESGKTVLFASHNIGFLRETADRCLYLDQGSLIEIGEPEKVCTLAAGA